ncbi:MAG: tryptophan-rich sensory protein, partial [Burkholderiaceae bacterium]|nr:tryptophan-rich sensory protein [Burkholderiaceae bacterium]
MTSPQASRKQLLIAALLAIAVAGAGGSLNILDDWYFGLEQPWFKPPDWAFGPAWTILFGLMAWSGALGWAASEGQVSRRRQLIWLWVANAVFNLGWSL